MSAAPRDEFRAAGRSCRPSRRWSSASGHTCDPATFTDQYTSQMLHVWMVPYPGGPFSDDLSLAATNAAARAALAGK